MITRYDIDVDEQKHVNWIEECCYMNLIYEWTDFLKSHLDHVFLLPKPSRRNVGKNYEFESHNLLKHFLKVNLLVDTIIKFDLSEKYSDYFLKFVILYEEQISETVKIFFKTVDQNSNEPDMPKINDLINTIKQFLSSEKCQRKNFRKR